MVKKACRRCRVLYTQELCPNCKVSDASDNWKGRLFIVDANKSVIAEKLKITQKGEYAIKL